MALGVGAFVGCTKHSEGDGHNHAAPAVTKQAEHEGHGDHDNEAHSDEVTLTTEAVVRYGVRAEPVGFKLLRPTCVAPARVSFNTDAMAHVGSPLRGRAVEVKVRVGDRVKRGDPLVVIESPELGAAQNDYFQKRSAAQVSAPAAELAKVAWERAKGLFEKSQGISLTEVQRREAEYKAAVATQAAAEAAVVGSENLLRLMGMSPESVRDLTKAAQIAPTYTVHAAIDGQVVEREVTLGELVSPDREALMVVVDTSTLWVLADVPEGRLHGIHPGAAAWVTIGGRGGQRIDGVVGLIAPQVHVGTRTAQVRIEVPAAAGGGVELKPGMFAEVEIVVSDSSDPSAQGSRRELTVPLGAVQDVEGGPAVFVPVEGEPNTYAKRAVSVGAAVGGLVPVLSGLTEGEEVVVHGTFILKAELGKAGAAHEH